MKKLSPYLLLLLILVPMSTIQAKRMAPAAVDPISYEGITYSAPTNMMGSVEARDEKTSQIVWTTKVYSVAYNPLIETDVQDVFITELQIDDGELLVTNESDEKYYVDLKTGAVARNPARSGWLIAAIIFILVGLVALYRFFFK